MIQPTRFGIRRFRLWHLAIAATVSLVAGRFIEPPPPRLSAPLSPQLQLVGFESTSAETVRSKSAEKVQPDDDADETDDVFSAQDLEFFETKVRPLLVEHCFECHGPDSELEGGLSLATRGDALLGGDTGSLIDSDNPASSLLIDAINWGDVYQMPPESKLADEEIAILTDWVKRGAPWTPGETESVAERMAEFDLDQRKNEHWCWQPIQQVAIPRVSDESWPIKPLDRFILAKLDANGLKPNGPAEKQTWLRRVYLDLIGMPPTVDELDRFLNDESPEAFEAVVDELLASERFGERWARHWMDLTRFAETCGHEFDYPIPHAWRYRDYLIRAFNADVPYDDFVREHIAGDLMPEPRRHPTEQYNESIIGTGFWFLGEATHAPVDVKGDEAGRVDNQIDVMSKTFLGLTIACARCHDHKFDAISTKDYYALAGFLQSSRRQEATIDPNGAIASAVAKLKELRVDAGEILAEQATQSKLTDVATVESLLRAAIGEPATDDLEVDESILARWKKALTDAATDHPSHPAYALKRLLQSANGEQAKDRAAGDAIASLIAHREAYEKSCENSVLFHDFTRDGMVGWFSSGSAFEQVEEDLASLFRAAPSGSETDNLLPRSAGSLTSDGLSRRLFGSIRSETFEITHPRIHYRMAGEDVTIRLIIDGYTMDVYNGLLFGDVTKKNVKTDGKLSWVQQAGDLGRYIGHRAHIEIIDHGDGFAYVEQIRFSNGNPPADPPSPFFEDLQEDELSSADEVIRHYANAIASFCNGEPAPSGSHELVDWMVRRQLVSPTDSQGEGLDELSESFETVANAVPHPTLVQAMADGTGENEFVFVRGNHRVLGDEAVRQPPEALIAGWSGIDSGSGRLQLAEKIADAKNPLTTRVIVNRVWHHLFGRGIVASVDNFGVLGQQPTHPQLLDHLAHEFATTHDWSIKSLLKQLVLSQTYRMSSQPQAAGTEADPNNDLLHRMRIRRLQSEAIRDSMLVVAGHLDTKMYGPSVPVHLTPFMQGRGRPGRAGPLDGNRRRSVYLEIRRNFLSPMMLAFDTPIPFNAMGRRNVSNVPAQALILMNDPFVHEEAAAWAEQILASETPGSRERIQLMYRQAFSRPATESEVARALAFLEVQAKSLGIDESDVSDHPRLWADLGHVLFNVKEFIYVK